MALLTWRFFTFYLFLIVGVGMVLLEKIILNREKKQRLAREGIPSAAETLPEHKEDSGSVEKQEFVQDKSAEN